MLRLCRDGQRHRDLRGRQDHRSTLFPRDPSDAPGDGFGALVRLDEIRLPPGDSTEPGSGDELEVITYVFRGALGQEEIAADSRVIRAGEFQRMSTNSHRRHKETCVSGVNWAHLFRISLRPAQAGLERAHEQQRFTSAQRRNRLCVVASPDGRTGSLRVHQDVLVYSAVVEPGHHMVHELWPGRSAWLHLVHGQVTLGDIVMTEGDGVGASHQPSVSVTVQEVAELLLVDLGPVVATLGPGRPATR